MSVIKKPDLKIFAQDAKTGEIETFPDVLRGWGVTLDRTAGKPPLEWFNALGKRVDEWLMYLTQRGVAEWDTTLSYPKTAIVQFNSVVYVSIKETKGEQPDKSQASWSTLGVFLGLGNYSTTAEMNLALLKKIDKANITNQTGNSTELVASQQLVTTETGKKASKEELNNGLASKFDKTGGAIAGEVRATGNITAVNSVIQASNSDTGVAMQLDATFGEPNVRSKRKTSNWRRHILQDKDGTLAHVGDFGFGGVGDYSQVLKNFNDDAEFIDFIKSGVTQTWRNQTNAVSSALVYQYASNVLIKTSDSFFNISAKYNSNDIRVISGLTNKGVADWNVSNLLTDKNTVTDRNGCIRTLNSNELSDYPVGAPIPWPQATPPAGYLVCNGQSFNKASYPLLAKAYPSGVLDDLRAEFIRGLDAGRGIDVGRAVRSSQSDMYKSHKHMRNSEGFEESANVGADGGFMGNYPGNSSNSYIRKYREVEASGGNETRPRNIAFLYIVRAA